MNVGLTIFFNIFLSKYFLICLCFVYNISRVEDAAIRYLNRKNAGIDVIGRN